MGRIILLSLAAFVVVAALIVYRRTVGGEGTAPTVAALRQTNATRRLVQSLPPDSTDIEYYWRWFDPYEEASFAVSESAFLDWARSRGWRVDDIAGGPAQLAGMGSGRTMVSDGYVTGGPEEGKWWGCAVYDRKTGRAYYERDGQGD
ncbi:MAG: hypothetical protein IMZ66_08465 [Planctomycetes bacterium]|nr:hypothetical protein [Planctomycetota bacterium]